MARILYLSYDGMTDALGESQVLSYLIELSNKGNEITLASFEKKTAYKNKSNRIDKLCQQTNIKWIPLKYLSKPPVFSTIIDIIKLKRVAFAFSDVDVVHCRGYITALVGLQLKRKKNIPFIFDMRGFWADEKLESGHWGGKLYQPIYKFFKKKEADFFNYSDRIISLTVNGKKEILSKHQVSEKKIITIPTCVNYNIFKPYSKKVKCSIKQKLKIPDQAKVFVYSGSLGGNYDISILINAYKAFFKKHPNSYLLILTKTIEAKFPKLPQKLEDRIIMKSVDYHEVSDYLMLADLGFIFYKKGYSTIGRYPTKLAEYWACGLPCLVYNKIGDTKELLDKYKNNGFYYFNKFELEEKMNLFNLDVDKGILRNNAISEFSLDMGVEKYHLVYKELLN